MSSRSAEEKLRLFVTRIESAASRRGIQDGTVRAVFKITGSAESSSFNADPGDEEDFRALILDFRHFLAQDEDVHAERILNLLERGLRDDELRECVRLAREEWKAAKRGLVEVSVYGKRFTAEQCFDMRVNGDLFHNDERKAAEYQALPDLLKAMVDHNVRGLLWDGLRALWPVRNIINKALAEGTFDGDRPAS